MQDMQDMQDMRDLGEGQLEGRDGIAVRPRR